MTTATCENEQCELHDLAQPVYVTLGPDAVVTCGVCGEPCALADDTDPPDGGL
jgi:hypothetical protein